MKPDFARKLQDIEALHAARVDARELPSLIDPLFVVQRQLLEDGAKLIAVLCTRRASKSFSAGKRLLRAMLKHPGASVLFVAKTRRSVKGIIWKDVLKVLNKEHKLGAVFNETELTMTLPNGAVLYALGVDTTDDEREKLLGQKYAEVAIDESASYTIDLNQLVFSVLKPAVADYRGVIGLYGTPGNLKTGLFYDLTRQQDPMSPGRWEKDGFSCHRWNTFHNPYMEDNWQAEIDELKKSKPFVEETPWFQQNYWGRWTIDESKLVYRYQPGRNDFDGALPMTRAGHWHYVLAVDLGFTDDCSFTVLAYHDNLRELYVMESSKQPGLDITATAERMKLLKSRYDIESTIIDGANKQAVQELNNRHGMEAQPADKREKAEFIDMMNDDFVNGFIRLSPKCEPLKEEYAGLVWDERALENRKRQEHAACANHGADSCLYGWRFSYAFIATALPAAAPKVNSIKWFEAQAELEKAKEDAYLEAGFALHQQAKDEAQQALEEESFL